MSIIKRKKRRRIMGRGRKKGTVQYGALFQLQLEEYLFQYLKESAKKEQITMSEYVRRLIKAQIIKESAKKEQITISEYIQTPIKNQIV